jgi:hypothetical protein
MRSTAYRRLVALALVAIGGGVLANASPASADPTVGAIRWDAWVGDLNTDPVGAPYVGQQVERTLGPNEYHDRLPFFAVETGTDSVQVRQLTQASMDQDIKYAVSAGLDYWAFVYYPDNSGMDTGRDLYDSSTNKLGLKYAWILGASSPNPSMSSLVTRFQSSDYMKVLGNRPLLYLYGTGGYSVSDITTLRSLTTAAGLGSPYVVTMAANPGSVGADAYGGYVTWPETTWSGLEGPFTGLANRELGDWNSARGSYGDVVPWVTVGLDTRPRYDNPVTWTTVPSNFWVEQATPSEIANQLQTAFDWTATYPSSTGAQTVLMYAWNEFDEGGWLTPTLYKGTDRVDAVRQVIDYSPGTNLAASGTFSASSQWDGTQTAAKAFDGSTSTNWQAASGSTYSNQWIEVDFGANRTFNHVQIMEYGGRTTAYQIQYWNGSSWATAHAGSAIGGPFGSLTVPSKVTFPPVTGSKARLKFTSGSATPIIYEFGIYNSPGRNLGLSRSYSASSQWDGTQTPPKAFDGNIGTNWQAALSSTYSDQWLEVDFGELTAFNRVVLSEYGGRTSGFRIEYWNGSSWATAYTGTTIGGPTTPSTFSFPRVVGTKARIKYMSGTDRPIVYEFELYDVP